MVAANDISSGSKHSSSSNSPAEQKAREQERKKKYEDQINELKEQLARKESELQTEQSAREGVIQAGKERVANLEKTYRDQINKIESDGAAEKKRLAKELASFKSGLVPKGYENQISKLREQLARKESKLQTEKSTRKELIQTWKEKTAKLETDWAAKKKGFEEGLASVKSNLAQEIASGQERKKEYKGQINGLKEQVARKESELQTEQSAKEGLIQAWKERMTKLEKGYQNQIGELKEQLAHKKSELQTGQSTQEGLIQAWKERITNLEKGYQDQIGKLSGQLVQIKTAWAAERKELDEELVSVKSNLAQEIASGQERKKEYEGQINGLTEQLARQEEEQKEAIGTLNETRISYLAPSITYFIGLSFIPFILLIMSVFGFIAQGIDTEFSNHIIQLVQSNVSVLKDSIQKYIGFAAKHKHILGLIGILALLWTSINLERIMRTTTEKPYLRRWLNTIIILLIVMLLFTFSMGLMVATTCNVIPISGSVLQSLYQTAGGFLPYLVSLVIFIVLFYVIYRIIPVAKPRAGTALAGAAVGAIIWQVINGFFSWYLLQQAAYYQVAHGSVTAFIYLVLWVYLFAISMLIGASVIQVIMMNYTTESEPRAGAGLGARRFGKISAMRKPGGRLTKLLKRDK